MSPTNKVLELIGKHQRFVILMHERPDGDTIACSLAFARVLRQLKKEVTCVSSDPIPKPFLFLPDVQTIESDFDPALYDVMIVLDCGDLRRTGFPDRVRQFARQMERVIHIDHHQKSDLYKLANVKLFDSTASATSQILYPLFQALPVTLDSDIATCLLTSLYYDTGAFKHANTNNQVLRLAAQLLHLGGRLRQITQHVDLTKSIASLRLWGIALARVKKHPTLQVVASCLTQKDIHACRATDEDVAGIVNLLNAVPESKAAILLTETDEGNLRASLRTEDATVDVAAVAELFGGGGLRRASGFCLPGKLHVTGNHWHVDILS